MPLFIYQIRVKHASDGSGVFCNRDAFPRARRTDPTVAFRLPCGRRERLSASVTYSQIDKLLHVFKFDHDGQ